MILGIFNFIDEIEEYLNLYIRNYINFMPILFNEKDSNSLKKIMICELTKAANTEKKWVFYAITCYFKPQVILDFLEQAKNILGNKLSGIHLLVDFKQSVKELVSLEIEQTSFLEIEQTSFIEQISKKTGLSQQYISYTPIDGGKNILFHAKSYALISEEKDWVFLNDYSGFVIVTSANFSSNGFNNNIEIGHILHDVASMRDFSSLVRHLKENYTVSADRKAEIKEFELAIQLLSKGSFYHKWSSSFDLIFRLNLSQEEIERLDEAANNPETKRKIKHFKTQQIKTIKDDPINLQSIFAICPKPIPSDIWRIYSIDTLLGKWVPNEIGQLIEEEVEDCWQIFQPLIKEVCTPEKIKSYTDELKEFVKEKIDERVIKLDLNNLSALASWEKRVESLFKNENRLKVYINRYEKINLSVTELDQDIIRQVYYRIKDFYNQNNQHPGIAKFVANLEDDFQNHKQTKKDKFYLNIPHELVAKAKDSLIKNRIQNLDTIKQGELFTAFKVVVVNQSAVNKIYERFDGIFIGLEDSSKQSPKDVLVYKLIGEDKEKKVSVTKLRTFKKQAPENKNEEEEEEDEETV
ncbi:hypothetical protein [Microcoleus sp.]|uniref:hypothetical protein n=1 Tax=Microcoleus sp. TaxID=44472 RepID=UPI003525B467